MQQLSKDRKLVLNRVRHAYKLFLLFDLDGTLVTDGGASGPKLKTKERGVLEQLLKLRECHVGVVSERPLEQVSRAVHVPGVHYSGSLGLEYAVPGGALVELAAEEALAEFEKFHKELKRRAAKTRGVKLERTGLHISLDWTKAAAGPRKSFAEDLKALETEHEKTLRVVAGRQASDYLPNTGHHKGSAVVAILRRVGFNLGSDLVIYIGDDVTNEDAFGAVADLGVSIRVGRPKSTSTAHYSVKNITEVWSFLKAILETRDDQAAAQNQPAARMF